MKKLFLVLLPFFASATIMAGEGDKKENISIARKNSFSKEESIINAEDAALREAELHKGEFGSVHLATRKLSQSKRRLALKEAHENNYMSAENSELFFPTSASSSATPMSISSASASASATAGTSSPKAEDSAQSTCKVCGKHNTMPATRTLMLSIVDLSLLNSSIRPQPTTGSKDIK